MCVGEGDGSARTPSPCSASFFPSSGRTGLSFLDQPMAAFLGTRVVLDDTLPPNVLLFRDREGNEIARVLLADEGSEDRS